MAKYIPSSMSTAKRGATQTQTSVCKLPWQRCVRIVPSNVSGCFVTVWRAGRLLFFKRLTYSCGIVTSRLNFMPAPVASRQKAVCTTVVEMTYNIRSLHVDRDVRATLLGIKESFSAPTLSICFHLDVVYLDHGAVFRTVRVIADYSNHRLLIR